MIRKSSLTLIPLAMLGMSSVAHAAGYIGLGLGEANVDIEETDYGPGVSSSADDSDTSFKLFGGYAFNPNFALEGGYIDFGESGARYTDGLDTLTEEYEANALYVAAIGIIPMNRFHVYGKAGIARWDVDASARSTWGLSVSDSDSGTDLLYGIGVGFDITPQITLRGEVERYNNVGDSNVTGESDVDVIGITAAMRF